jgi:hypothetical protein
LVKPHNADSGYRAVLRAQTGINERTDGNAERYSEHRRHLMDAVIALAPDSGGRLCLLGAGNCNDVDLVALARHFDAIHLVDLDATALSRAEKRQPDEVRARLHLHGPVDLGGLLRETERWQKKPPTLARVEAAIAPAVQTIVAGLPGSFSVVASCCVLTQIGHGITSILGPQHPNLGDAHTAAAVVHLRVLAGLLATEGRGLFVTDLVSTDTYPLDELTPGRDLRELVAELVRTGNHFKGVSPLALSRLLRRDAVLSRQVMDVQTIDPWLWRAVQARTFLVNGFVFRRAASS